ncbi:MAG: YgiT-type zinc finger protein [Desulfobacteraceae bacterium]|nr:MAG: YgiT-type zinc finger protein [Desulfobacteraceae bacterium]
MVERERICGFCGGKLTKITIGQIQEYNQDIGAVVFENVPALQCTECGEKWFEGQILEAMDAVLAKSRGRSLLFNWA